MQHFDAVVVGSGFGGSVVACRLARANRRVLVLERGQRHPPGSFPRVLQHVRSNFWDPSEGLHGLYNVWFFRRVGALVASGLGGGSLIYANVMLRKDPAWFEGWPITRDDLEPHYDAIERVLTPVEFPHHDVSKVNAFREAAARVQARNPGVLSVIHPKIAVSFDRPPATPNLHDNFPRGACTSCGECVVGCNVGAKNTLDFTYLSLAHAAGATILADHEVMTFAPDGRKIVVHYRKHDPTGRRPPERGSVSTSKLVLAAGTFGSTFLLLKNLPAFGTVLPALGTRFSGNGDLLSFAINCATHVDATRGPTITTALRHADRTEGHTIERGFYLEDAGFPKELAWLAEGFRSGGWLWRGLRFLRELKKRMTGHDPDTDLGKELSDLLGSADFSARMLPLLAMGMDEPDGRFRIDGTRLQLDWSRARSARYFANVRAVARALAEELGGKHVQHIPALFGRAVTVHPLGGCPMGTSPATGVVDPFGKCFAHEGLYVVDGSILPGPVGPNPALTIAAVADRAADAMLA